MGTGSARQELASRGSAARTIVAGPDQEVDQLVLVLLSAINLARRSIRVATPYFLPDEQLITALQLAVLRGVDVHLVLPSHTNHRLVAWAAQTHIRPLLQSGCHLWRSAPPFDHSKLMTIDGSWSLIGSANWDMRSLRLNFELTVEFYDTDLAGKLAGMIDARCAQPITLEEIDKRPLPVKLRDAAARLAMPYIKESRSLLKVASYNIHRCRGVDGVTRPDRIIGVIREFGADVIALQEVDRRFGRGGGLLDPSAIARETMRLLVQSDVSHRHGWHGNALLVRGEPISYRRARLKLPGGEPRGAVVAELDLGEGEFRVIAAHLGLFRLSRVDQVSALLTAFRDLPPMPSILLGDLNEWRRRGRSALRGLEPTFGVSPSILSFPSRRPIFALDRILGWPEGLITDLAVHDTPLSRRSSDHLPLTARANLRSAIPALQFAA